MKKFLLLTTALALAPAAVTAKEVNQIVPAETLHEIAKDNCDVSANSAEGWAVIRTCIARTKTEYLVSKDPRIAKACSGYSNDDRSACAMRLYESGDTSWNPKSEALRQNLREKLKPYHAGEHPADPDSRTQEHTPGGVTGGKSAAPSSSGTGQPASKTSTITGPIVSPSVSGGGTAPAYRVNRPASLGGGTSPAPAHAPSNSTVTTPQHNGVGGVSLKGTVSGTPGSLGVTDDVLKLQKGVAAPPKPEQTPTEKPACSSGSC
jgi:hypothetical protein